MLALVGCQPVATVPKPARGGTAVEALIGQATVLNPLFETNESMRDVDSLIYQGLTAVDGQQDVIGVLASDWAVSPDHLTYTFDIRDGVKWADGEAFGADDVLFTFGGGYQIALAPAYRAKPLTPAYDRAWLLTIRLNFK